MLLAGLRERKAPLCVRPDPKSAGMGRIRASGSTASQVYLYVSDADPLHAEWAAAGEVGSLGAPFGTPYGLREFSLITRRETCIGSDHRSPAHDHIAEAGHSARAPCRPPPRRIVTRSQRLPRPLLRIRPVWWSPSPLLPPEGW